MAEMIDNEALDWDDEIEDNGIEYIKLDEGDYVFVIENLQRERFEGSDKAPECPRAALTLAIPLGDGRTAHVYDGILIHKENGWRVTRFFESLGFVKEPSAKDPNKLIMRPHWNEVIGKTGVATIKQRTYTNRNGEERTTNSVDRYLKPDEVNNERLVQISSASLPAAAPQPTPAAQAQPANQQQQWSL